MESEFKGIKGYEGLYSIGKNGIVKSLHSWRGIKGKILKQFINSNGYQRVFLTKDGKTTGITVHKLVTTTFLGERPKGKQVRHLDGNKLNNELSNLVYGTAKENADDRKKHGNTANGMNIGSCKLSNDDVLTIRQSYKKRGDMVKLAKEYNVTCANIYMIIKNKSRKNG